MEEKTENITPNISGSNEIELKRILEFIPLVTIWEFIFSSIFLFSYYNVYSINIFNYIDITELIIIGIPKFGLFILFLFLFIFTLNLFPFKLKRDVAHMSEAHSEFEHKFFYTTSRGMIILNLFLYLITFFISKKSIFTYIHNLFIGFGLSALIMSLSYGYIYIKKGKPELPTLIFLVIFYISIFISGFYGIIQCGYDTDSKKGISIIYNGKELKSTKTYYYIGNTRAYTFFYNDSTKLVDVFPASQITKMSIK